MKNSTVRLLIACVLTGWSMASCDFMKQQNNEETPFINTENQQAISEEQNKKKFRDNIAAYVYMKEDFAPQGIQGLMTDGPKYSLGYIVVNETDYTIDEVIISVRVYNFKLQDYVEEHEKIMYIPAHSRGDKHFSESAKIISIKCRALGLY